MYCFKRSPNSISIFLSSSTGYFGTFTNGKYSFEWKDLYDFSILLYSDLMNGPKGSSVEIERKVFIFWFISRIESSLTKRDVKSMLLYVT